MNILFVTDHYLPVVNGVVNQLIMMRHELEKRGHHVTIIAPQVGTKKEKNTDPHVIHIRSIPTFWRPHQDRISLPFSPQLRHQIKMSNFDIVHTHGVFLGTYGMTIAKEKNIPHIVTLHLTLQEYLGYLAPWIPKITNKLCNVISKLFLDNFDMIIAPSKKASSTAKKSRTIAPIKIIHNGIQIEGIQNADPKMFLKKYGIQPDEPLVIIVGRVDPGKNVHLAIKAMRKIIKKNNRVKLAIIGDGSKRKQCETLIEKYGLEKNIFITGFISYDLVKSATQACKLAIMTSDSDILPTVAIEAISAGKPMVAVNDEAIQEIVHHGVNGILTTKDPEKIAKGIQKMLENKKLYLQYSKASLRISKEFSIETSVNNLEKAYHENILNYRHEHRHLR